MFTTTAVVLTVCLARWLERRTAKDRPLHTRQDVKLVGLLGVVLIILGVTADRIT
jgi:membrane protein implicated in regulation of membrane protease activity